MGVEEDRRIAHSLEKIATCAELLTQILTDNRETINLTFKSTKTLLEINERHMKEFFDEKDDNSDTGFNVDETFNL
jgi:hypothetical protein